MSSSNLPVPLVVVGAEAAPHFLDDQELLTDFLGDLTANTRRAYDGDLRDFARSLGLNSPWAGVAVLLSKGAGEANRLALRYKIDMFGRGLKPNTVRRRLAALRSVVNLARRLGRIPWVLDCPGPRAEVYKDTRGPGAGWKDMRKVAAADAATGKALAVRDRAMVRVCHDLGLRVAELLSLDLEHVEFSGGETSVWVLGKGRKERERLTVPENTALPLAAWLAVRGLEAGPLFVRLDRAGKGNKGRLTSRSAARTVGALAVKAGIARRLSPHGLRHHAITEVLDRNGGNMVFGQEFSRHADPRSLQDYYDHLKDHHGAMAALISDKD